MKYKLNIPHLFNENGSPNEASLALLHKLHAKGFEITLQSQQGSKHAAEIAKQLGVYELCEWALV